MPSYLSDKQLLGVLFIRSAQRKEKKREQKRERGYDSLIRKIQSMILRSKQHETHLLGYYIPK